jgi:hypothetical protein
MDVSDAFDHESLPSTDDEANANANATAGGAPPAAPPQLQRENETQGWILARGRRQARLREVAAAATVPATAGALDPSTAAPATPGRDRKIRRLETRIRELEQRVLTCIVCHAGDATSYFAIVPCGHVSCATCLLVFMAVNPTSNIPCTLNDMRTKKCPTCRTPVTSWQRIYR